MKTSHRRSRYTHVFTALLCAAVFGNTYGANLYKYKDASGRWVMTDKKPPQGAYEQQQLVFTEAQAKVTVVNRGSRERPVLYAVSHIHGPVQVRIALIEQNNVRLSQAEPLVWTFDGPKDQYLMHMQPQSPGQSWSYRWSYEYTPGPAVDDFPSETQIGVPVAGGPYYVSQGFMGEASHSGHAQSHYAVDIAVPEGTPVIAVAPGRVMDVERNFSRSGWAADYADEANFVRVLHKDGSMAVYAHLQPDGIEVVAGQSIKAGQLLAYSGNTGFSTGPHLHFALQINRAGSLQSVPFRFANMSRAPKVGDAIMHKDKISQ